MMDKRQTPYIRPRWDYSQWHRDQWLEKNVTAVMCQRDTPEVTKLCIESLLANYPDLPLLIVDGGSKDDSLFYVRYKAMTVPNVTLWERRGENAHGVMLHEAIKFHIRTKYVLLLDNDIIVKRSGWIEQILSSMERDGIYAMGTLNLTTLKNDACGFPDGEDDILRYTHPSCSIINRDTYLKLPPFCNHGAPLVYNMKEAQFRGLKVEYFPIEYYVAHLSGASWCEPRTVWKDDIDVLVRPFVSFISFNSLHTELLQSQTDKDFEILVPDSENVKTNIAVHDYYHSGKQVNNNIYNLRFRVHGEYVCMLGYDVTHIDDGFMKACKSMILSLKAPEEADIGGLRLIKRKLWQCREALS